MHRGREFIFCRGEENQGMGIQDCMFFNQLLKTL